MQSIVSCVINKKILKEKIDEIGKKNSESWENDKQADAVICCLLRDIKDMIDAYDAEGEKRAEHKQGEKARTQK